MKSTFLFLLLATLPARAGAWADDPVWHDGLAEKAVYSASRIVYDHARPYEAVFFTNKEQHDRNTWTKSQKSPDTIEVWKFNQIEAIPTPNYTYHYETTAHLAVSDLSLTRLDCSSQEFCGASFKQFTARGTSPQPRAWDYWSFSYMPEAGRLTGWLRQRTLPIIPADALPLVLRNFDFAAQASVEFDLLPTQKSNRPAQMEPATAQVKYIAQENSLHKLELRHDDTLLATFWMASDRGHLMVKYLSADGQSYNLKSVERVDYWTRHEPSETSKSSE